MNSKRRSWQIILQVNAEKERLNNRLLKHDDSSLTVGSESSSSTTSSSIDFNTDNVLDSEDSSSSTTDLLSSSIKTISISESQTTTNTTATTTTTTKNNNNNKNNNKRMKKVRFYPFNDINIIESHHNMSCKEKRKYWWKQTEIVDMQPTYQDLFERRQQQQQQQRSNDIAADEEEFCIRGLEVLYWKIKIKKQANFHQEKISNIKHANEFFAPPRKCLNWYYDNKNNNNNNDVAAVIKRGLREYRNYLHITQKRAHILALIDEMYVMEHVYGLSCSHLEILWDDRWDYLKCGNGNRSQSHNIHRSNSNEFPTTRRRRSSSCKELLRTSINQGLGKAMKGMSRRRKSR